jgi:hypothetical protein
MGYKQTSAAKFVNHGEDWGGSWRRPWPWQGASCRFVPTWQEECASQLE